MIDNSKLKDEDFKDSTIVKVGDESIVLQSCVAYSILLKRKIKVVRLRKAISKHSYQEAILFSTDTNVDILM
ncbi:MAG: hypothetical protein NT124_04950 [Candidatus Dependentiae bacterium]|nr:hypothetical protein [Candidatus Dependentiae bacterium]